MRDSAHPDRRAAPKDPEFWKGKTNQDIARWLRSQAVSPKDRDKRAAKRLLSRSFVQYDDLSLFALSATLLFLLLIHVNPRSELLRLALRWPFIGLTARVTALLLCASSGMLLSFVGVFLRREKSELEKWLTLLFAIAITAGTGIYGGIVVMREASRWLVVFPAWNILNGLILLSLFGTGIVNIGSITGERANLLQVLLALASIGVLLVLCRYVFRVHWVIAYSICVCYTMNLHRAVRDFFGKRPRRT